MIQYASLLMLLEESKLADLIAQRKYPRDLNELGGRSKLLPYAETELKSDDVLYIRAASGGGYGDPLEREPQLVFEDVRNGLVSKATAEQIYGVVIDESTLAPDLSMTEELRLKLRQKRTEAFRYATK
jgi:N-methylhydantoinase B